MTAAPIDIGALAQGIRAARGLAGKADIAEVAARLGLDGSEAIPVGDDCAAIPDGDGFLLLAIEGFISEFVAADPWFAGWCGVMVNLSDIAAMGGRPIAVVDAIWAKGADDAEPILRGLRDASTAYGVPVVGGHSNLRAGQCQLSVAVLGRAKRLLTSFDAKPGERLIAAIDLRGAYRAPFANWQAAIGAPSERLRGDLDLLPQITEAGLSKAGKDISQAGIIGTAAMLAECSGAGAAIDLGAIPLPEGADVARWLQTFPSFGFLLTATLDNAPAVVARFAGRGIAAADIGAITAEPRILLGNGHEQECIWDFSRKPLMALGGASP